jgi:hypothetical protein
MSNTDLVCMPRGIVNNILLNKHKIKIMPSIDSSNPEHVEEIIGNELRTLKKYPLGYDFIVNVISKVKSKAASTGKSIGEYYKEVSEDYYEVNVEEETFTDYFSESGDHTIRQSLKRQVITDLNSGFVFIRSKDYIARQAPFRIMGVKRIDNKTKVFQIFLLKQLFESLITGDSFKTGGEGYIEIPAKLFPILTKANKQGLQSYNPAYKLQVFGLMKNTNKKTTIKVNRGEFLETIAPEYYKKGYLDVSESFIHSNLISMLKETEACLPESFIVRNFYIGEGSQESTIHFNNPTNGRNV